MPARGARTHGGGDSAEPPNRFVLHLRSIDESSEHEVHYGVDDIPVDTRGILRDHLVAACAHELNLTQLEWDTVTTFLTTLPQPRRTSKEKLSNLGESRASDHYGHNTDVDETVLDALVTQYMLTDSAPEMILIREQGSADGLSVKVEEHKIAD